MIILPVIIFVVPVSVVGSYEKARNKQWQQYQKDIQKIKEDKYERQLLKTFDVLSWIENKITRRSLAEILAEKSQSY